MGGRTLVSHPRSFWRGLTLFDGCQGTKAERKDLPRTQAAGTKVGGLGCGQMRVRGLASCAAPRKRWCIPKHLCSSQSSGFSIQPSVIGDAGRWLHAWSHGTGEEWVELWGFPRVPCRSISLN